MFSLVKSWDNRQHVNGAVKMLPSGKSWTRRIQWLEDEGLRIKLKLQDGDTYKEVMAFMFSAVTIWKRFKDGCSIDDSISILGADVPASLQSRKATNKEQP